MGTRSPEEILKAIEDADIDAAIEEVLAMSPEERRRELEASGIDMKALDAEADAFYARLHGDRGAQPTVHVPDAEPRSREATAVWERGVAAAERPRFSRRWAVPLAATLGVAAIGVTTALPALLAKRDERLAAPDPSATTPQRPSARQLRERATSKCREQRWQECVDDLAAARTLDPGGDEDERVRVMWREAREALDPHLRTPPKYDLK